MKVGDRVRLKRRSRLAGLLGPVADACGRVGHTYQDDDDGLRISVIFTEPEQAYTSPLPAEEFERVGGEDAGAGCVRERVTD